MNSLETNIFPIENLGQFKSRYRLYHIRGLTTPEEEYERNKQTLINKLSYKFESPVTVIVKQDQPYLVLREDAPEPPSPYPLVGTAAIFERSGDVMTLDFSNPTEETAPICQRFLQFAINGALRNHRVVWQPSPGQPFFYRRAEFSGGGIDVYRGASVRVVTLEDYRPAICVDMKHKYVARYPLGKTLSGEDFRRIKNGNFIYHYGSQWYEIKAREKSDLSVREYTIPDGKGGRVPLKEWIMNGAPRPLTTEVVDLDESGTVLIYKTGRGDARGAPSALCYAAIDTEDTRTRGFQKRTILAPHIRRYEIANFVRTVSGSLRFGETPIKVGTEPLTIAKKQFLPPDLTFGHGTTLSVRGTQDTIHVNLNDLGENRLSALFSRDIGPFSTKPLDQQYFIWPRSVASSYGPAFLKELKKTVDDLFPGEIPYDPEVITYDDSGPRRYATQGRAIRKAVEDRRPRPGFGVVMLHELEDKKSRQEDPLASMVMRELRNIGLYVAVIHTKMGRRSYELPPNSANGTEYRRVADPAVQGRLEGYLRNVALVKVLLTNERWPFVLGTPLNADVTIGIDVKPYTACFSFLGKTGADIRTETVDTSQKEMLDGEQVRTVLLKLFREEMEAGKRSIHSVAVHRDGRFFHREIKAIESTIDTLKKEKTLPDDVSLNLVEVSKSSPAPLRLFDISNKPGGREFTMNPEVGSYWLSSKQDAYICSTGRAFPRPGTAKPLHMKYLQGSMPFEKIVEDLYALTCLAWTRPEDCTRHPLTIKLADIRLREFGGKYDKQELEYDEEYDGEEIEDE